LTAQAPGALATNSLHLVEVQSAAAPALTTAHASLDPSIRRRAALIGLTLAISAIVACALIAVLFVAAVFGGIA
jgi:hypothetical protein